MSDTTNTTTVTPPIERAGFLISQLGSYAARRFTARLAPLNLQPRHFGLLTHLASADGQTQQQLADMMGIHRNAMVNLIDDMENRGLVQRRQHPTDRRAHAVHLTATARDLFDEAQHAADEHDAELLAALSAADRAHLITLLQRVAASTTLRGGVHPELA